jgi:DNA-binding NtrC family response regulator
VIRAARLIAISAAMGYADAVDGRRSSRDETTYALAREGRRPLAAVVRVLGARATPRELVLARGSCTLGAGRDVDVIIDDATVSRSHARLSLVPEGVAVEDLGSRNGTHYLGQRVQKMVLSLGSRLTFGTVEVAIEPKVDDDARARERDGYGDLIGVSAAMRRLFGTLERLEGSLVNVLVEGESGVGKELIARALHAGSHVHAGPFRALNCGAIARELSASELFGHRRGAFTGAVDDRAGAFESAHGGTLFLDEIGELPLDAQPVLLRALETGEVTRVGDDAPRSVKVRVVSATNRVMDDELASGRFREDLFYRLAVVKLSVPPLRERRDDIEPLARRFAAEAGASLAPEVIAALAARPWPGNARELKNAVQAYLAVGSLPQPAARREGLEAALAAMIDTARPYQDLKRELLDHFNRLYLERVLAETGGNQSEAARLAGMDRSYFRKLMTKR